MQKNSAASVAAGVAAACHRSDTSKAAPVVSERRQATSDVTHDGKVQVPVPVNTLLEIRPRCRPYILAACIKAKAESGTQARS
eukprot:1151268-Pelagomonas_calceolata.AAC.9